MMEPAAQHRRPAGPQNVPIQESGQVDQSLRAKLTAGVARPDDSAVLKPGPIRFSPDLRSV